MCAGVAGVGVAVGVGRLDRQRLCVPGGLRRRARDDEACCSARVDCDVEAVGAGGAECAVGDGDDGCFDLVELHRAAGRRDAARERDGGRAPEVDRGGGVVGDRRCGDRVGRAVGTAEGEVLRAGVGGVGVAVRVGRGDRDGLRGAGGLRGRSGHDETGCRCGADGHREAVAAGARDRAVVRDDVGGLRLVELQQAGGDTRRERQRRVGGAEVLVGGEAVAEGGGVDRARGARRSGEGEGVVAGIGEVGVAVRVGCGDRRGLRAARGLRRGAGDDEA